MQSRLEKPEQIHFISTIYRRRANFAQRGALENLDQRDEIWAPGHSGSKEPNAKKPANTVDSSSSEIA